MIDPKKRPLWIRFVTWANENDVDLTYEDDWKAWWDCFLAGACAFVAENP